MTTTETPVSSFETISSVAFAMVVKAARDRAVQQCIAAGVEHRVHVPDLEQLIEQCLTQAITLLKQQPSVAEDVNTLVSDKLRKLVFEGTQNT